MDVGTLEQWLWDAACEIRGPLDAPKFKDYILPLVFLKRLSGVFKTAYGNHGPLFRNLVRAHLAGKDGQY